MSSLEHNWNVEMSYSVSGGLASGLVQQQFSMSASYGGSKINTNTQSYEEKKIEKQSLKLKIPANSKLVIWQYQVGLGEMPLLFTNKLTLTNGPYPKEEPHQV